jgi:hypothetical protein
MSKQVRFRRGTTAQHASFTGVAGELTVDTDKDVPVVHDGTTAGGIPLLRKDRPRGMTRMEIFTSNSTWTLTNKTDLKRIRVTCYGGGGGGGAQAGGGGGGISQVVLELTDLTTNVAVTIGSGAGSGSTGGTTSFGSYISATGGSPGSGYSGGAGGGHGGAGGGVSGNPVYTLGGQGACQGETSQYPARNSSYSVGRMVGAGFGGNRSAVSATGVRGGGGGNGASGAQGCIIVEEFYGFV